MGAFLAGKRFVRRMRRDIRGATAIEYGLIAALIAIAVLLSTGSLGESMNIMFENILGATEGASQDSGTPSP